MMAEERKRHKILKDIVSFRKSHLAGRYECELEVQFNPGEAHKVIPFTFDPLDTTPLAAELTLEIVKSPGVKVLPAKLEPIPVHAVKDECARRITKAYPLGKQNSLMMEGGTRFEEMKSWIQHMTKRSNEIEAMEPIPPDFRADRWWV